MNNISEIGRKQMRIESYEDSIFEDNEVRVIDKIVDVLNIESLGFKLGNNLVTSPGGFSSGANQRLRLI
jgi:hypothetical protein